MLSKEKVSLPRGTKVPDHIAIILDGNRRWARSRGFPTLYGHKAGFEAGMKVAEAARNWGVHTVSVWGFSTENWDRSAEEISYLMKLYGKMVREVEKKAKREQIRFVHLGRKDRFPKDLVEYISKVEEATKHFKKHVFNVGLDFGGRDEIVRATQKIIADKIPADKVDEKLFARYLDTGDQPYPYVDLYIRTSGELRTSGFMMWQSEYAEFYWERDHLPDMSPNKLKEAILDYSRRRRRFGGQDTVEHLRFKPEVSAHFELAWWRLSKIPEGTKFSDYVAAHVKEQFGLSKILAKEAAIYMKDALKEGNSKKWEKAQKTFVKFYKLVKEELKLAFEPSIVASLEVKILQKTSDAKNISTAEVEDLSRKLVAEVYRISDFQAAKPAHLRALASKERNLAEMGAGEEHWDTAKEYLIKYYKALKEKVA